ncbi:MAG: 3-phosphoshikimate 1-carboxyvinyltransferase [Candidatus Zixiibacteriota bacterium]|nr:MAG: 3-phosphoshikimate 1-carboxyvinyltransferase [candidate division Zixibacteria bacterium]
MRRELHPRKRFSGQITVPGDKSIAHRAALLSILSAGSLAVKNYPRSEDCLSSLGAAEALGVKVGSSGQQLELTPPEKLRLPDDGTVNCGNSATTARLLSGIIAGSSLTVTLTGDDSLSPRPMDRVIEPLTSMGAELFAEDGHLPVRIVGRRLMPMEYQLPVASAQVKSALLLAGLASSCSVTVREPVITRDHTERMIQFLKGDITVREVKPVMVPDPVDPRKKRMHSPESFKMEITLASGARLTGGLIDIPGDFSTAAYFMAGAAIGHGTVTIENVGLNPTRVEFLEYLKAAGCRVDITDRRTESDEPRGTITVARDKGPLKSRKISGEITARLIDEIPALAVVAAFAEGTTVVRDAGELRIKESNRLESIAENLRLMGIKCGVLEDGLVIEGGKEPSGADFKSFGDHRIAMAFSVASCFLVGPSSIDDASVVNISCPEFYEILGRVTA